MSVKIFLDSGAFSFYNQLGKVRSATKGDTVMGRGIQHSRLNSVDYVKSPEYLKYRQDYVDFVKKHEAYIEVYANLDVIGNAELTYKNQKWLEKQGLKPTPVWHMGSDKVWLHRYLSEGYTYICIGGMVGNTKAMLRPALDSLWRKELTDPSGMPLVRVHAFGMTSFELMARYPWYSVDSKSWNDYGRRGRILVPSLEGGKKDYLNPYIVYTTTRRLHQTPHFRTMTDGMRRGVLRYLREINVPLGKSEFKKVPQGYVKQKGEQWAVKADNGPGEIELTIEPGIVNSYKARDDANIQFYLEVERRQPKWPWALPHSIKRGKRGLLK